MIKAFPGMNTIASMLNKPDLKRKASIALSRILTQLDMRDLPYDTELNANRRNDVTRHVSIGIWLIPMDSNQSPSAVDTSCAQPAVTCDLRRQGIGVLVPAPITATRFLVAVADLDEVWRFFLAEVRHHSPRPGGWFQLGLDVLRIVDLEPQQSSGFRNRTTRASAAKS
ncbi:MAG: hypothetical protein KDB01_27460 [Planctomycetaceae bacterium]|nr:hypothetical protein [Planctomycetaceae bacterium]